MDIITKEPGNSMIFNDLIMNALTNAAFYTVIVSLKMDFKCNIYVYKPFLAHTESITH